MGSTQRDKSIYKYKNTSQYLLSTSVNAVPHSIFKDLYPIISIVDSSESYRFVQMMGFPIQNGKFQETAENNKCNEMVMLVTVCAVWTDRAVKRGKLRQNCGKTAQSLEGFIKWLQLSIKFPNVILLQYLCLTLQANFTNTNRKIMTIAE